MVVQMIGLRYADDIAPPAPNVFDADEDIGFRPALGIGETKYVLQEFGLLVLNRLGEAILFLLEVERRTLFFVEELFELLVIHVQPPSLCGHEYPDHSRRWLRSGIR
jgi:hypothetical protein